MFNLMYIRTLFKLIYFTSFGFVTYFHEIRKHDKNMPMHKNSIQILWFNFSSIRFFYDQNTNIFQPSEVQKIFFYLLSSVENFTGSNC